MNNLDLYTSTGAKYVHHPQMIESLRNGIGRPQSLQVAITNRCNMKCVFCSVAERELKQEWNYTELRKAIELFISVGIKTIEFSGGGEPTLYPQFNELVKECHERKLKLGLITNGLKLEDLPIATLTRFDWIRISMVALDYQEKIDLPDKFPDNVTIGMSYVVGQKEYQGKRTHWKSDFEQLMKIKNYADRYNVKFIRVVPECMSDKKEMKALHDQYNNAFASFMFQPKRQTQAEYCYMDAVKPWLHCDGYVYPCNSISLNTDANRDFAPQYRLCHWTDIGEYYKNRSSKSLDVSRCDRCTFVSNNEIIRELMQPIEHGEFV